MTDSKTYEEQVADRLGELQPEDYQPESMKPEDIIKRLGEIYGEQ